MQKHRKRTPGSDGLASWRTWLDHQYDPGYWPSTGHVPPSWHIFYGCLFVLMATVLLLVALVSLLTGGVTNGRDVLVGLVGGGLLLAWGVRLLRKARIKRSVSQRHGRRKRH